MVRLDPGLPVPQRAHPDDAGLDLCSRTDVEIAPGERALVGTGVSVALPTGYAAFVCPRSGLAAREGLGLLNAPGTVDAGYRGEIQVCLVNHDPRRPVVLRRGDRVAQLVIQRVELPTVRVVDELPLSGRGAGVRFDGRMVRLPADGAGRVISARRCHEMVTGRVLRSRHTWPMDSRTMTAGAVPAAEEL